MKPLLLQLCDLLPSVQANIDARFDARRWPHDPGEQDSWLAQHAGEVRGLISNGQLGLPLAVAERLPNLGMVAINGVGFDQVDLDYVRRRNIRVSNTPDVLTDDVADLAIALMLNCLRRLPAAERHVRDGRWPSAEVPVARRASGLRYGIVGLGRIGQGIAKRLGGFGGTIAYSSPTRRPHLGHDYHKTLVSLAAASDVLFVAAAASGATRHMIDRAVLDALGPDGVLVNVARGSIIDEDALVEALVERRIAGAGLDVFSREPHVPQALLALETVALAPHVGAATRETREAMGALVLQNLVAFFAGEPLPTPVA
jgi:hydroxypyruvate reductase